MLAGFSGAIDGVEREWLLSTDESIERNATALKNVAAIDLVGFWCGLL